MPPGSWYGGIPHLWKERARTLDVAEALNAFALTVGAADAELTYFITFDLIQVRAGRS
ncbi:hypothetical protein ES708_21984 [subsurface metagenome]